MYKYLKHIIYNFDVVFRANVSADLKIIRFDNHSLELQNPSLDNYCNAAELSRRSTSPALTHVYGSRRALASAAGKRGGRGRAGLPLTE